MNDRPPTRLEDLDGEPDGRRFSPSAGRNQRDVVDALAALLPPRGVCLEVAAGTGEHAALAARRLPGWRWRPTDRDAEALASIEAWARHASLPNLAAPVLLDVAGDWPCEASSLDAVFASNLTHISPLSAAAALMRSARAHLRSGGALLLYGPVFLPGERRPDGNAAFDRELQQRDPSFGVRTLEELDDLATRTGLLRAEVRRMPVDNVMLRFRAPLS